MNGVIYNPRRTNYNLAWCKGFGTITTVQAYMYNSTNLTACNIIHVHCYKYKHHLNMYSPALHAKLTCKYKYKQFFTCKTQRTRMYYMLMFFRMYHMLTFYFIFL